MNNVEASDSKLAFKRTFKIDPQIISFSSNKNVVQASFFDLYDDVNHLLSCLNLIALYYFFFYLKGLLRHFVSDKKFRRD